MAQFKLKTGLIGAERAERKPPKETPVSLEQVLGVIAELEVPETIRKRLAEVASGYPQGGLRYFLKNIKTCVINAQKQINDEKAK